MTVEDLIDAHATARERVVERVVQTISQTWLGLGAWNRDDIEVFVSRVVPVISAGQSLTAQLVDIYVAQVITEITGSFTAPVGVPAAVATGGRGVPPAEVYTRPFIQLWADLAKGVLFNDAFKSATSRLTELADDDMSLAYRHATSSVMTRQSRVTGYRRVIRPELSRGGSCPLCQTASENTYHRKDLLPIHTHCRCGVIPIIGSSDVGRDLNDSDRTISAPVATVTHLHGELGPVLYPAGQHFDGPASIAA